MRSPPRRQNIDAWTRAIDQGGLDAIIITASGCGTTIKDYGYMLREDPAYAQKAERVSALAKDITEYLATIALPAPVNGAGLVVAYHSACSMQHGQKITVQPKALLKAAGFTVKDPPEGHLCCGSAGTYNIMQPEIARTLRDRKVANIERTRPDLIAAGNIGCITQIAGGTDIPIIHTGRAAGLGLWRRKAGRLADGEDTKAGSGRIESCRCAPFGHLRIRKRAASRNAALVGSWNRFAIQPPNNVPKKSMPRSL